MQQRTHSPGEAPGTHLGETMKPRLLDLFCGSGDCSFGYHLAGFEVVGIDIVDQPHYPFTFIQADAMTFPLEGYDVIHASPPCQGYTRLNYSGKEDHPKLIGAIRDRLEATGVPYIIENVAGASPAFSRYLMLCGSMFNLPVRRHRLFESNVLLFAPGPCRHGRSFYSIHGDHVWNRAKRGPTRQDGRWRPGYGTFSEGKAAMGIDWMQTQHELANAIPPAYTQWIGAQFLQFL